MQFSLMTRGHQPINVIDNMDYAEVVAMDVLLEEIIKKEIEARR
jgi:hypothetical protein